MMDLVSTGLTPVKIKSTSTLQFPEQIPNTASLHRLEEFRLSHEMINVSGRENLSMRLALK